MVEIGFARATQMRGEVAMDDLGLMMVVVVCPEVDVLRRQRCQAQQPEHRQVCRRSSPESP